MRLLILQEFRRPAEDYCRWWRYWLLGQPRNQGARCSPDGGYAPEAKIESGDTLTMWVDSDDAVTVLFHDLDTEESARLDRWNGDGD